MLPLEKSKPKENLFDYVTLFHGPPKIGKSTLISEIGDVLFADCEGGLSALEVYKYPIPDWLTFLSLCKEFTTEEHKFKAMCIDTADALHSKCTSYLMDKYDIIHPSDLEWGKGYDLVKTEFLRPMIKLSTSPYGLILISHTQEKEITTRTSKITKHVPSMANYVWKQIEGFVDIVIYCYTEESGGTEKRWLTAKPSEKWIAGDRTKRLLRHEKIPLVSGKGWEALSKAFEVEPEKEEEEIIINNPPVKSIKL